MQWINSSLQAITNGRAHLAEIIRTTAEMFAIVGQSLDVDRLVELVNHHIKAEVELARLQADQTWARFHLLEALELQEETEEYLHATRAKECAFGEAACHC